MSVMDSGTKIRHISMFTKCTRIQDLEMLM